MGQISQPKRKTIADATVFYKEHLESIKRSCTVDELVAGFLQNKVVREHVAGDGIAVARERAVPLDAGAAGVLADAALHIDGVELALLASFIRGD